MCLKVSIIIPTYNRLNYLSKCINSIKNNTSSNYEIIVIDGGSTDGTKGYIKKQDRVRPIFAGKLEGAVRAFNKGFKEAEGEYICWLNDDIIVLDGAIDKLLLFLNKKGNEGIGIGAFYFMESKREAGSNYRIEYVNGLVYANFGIVKRKLIEELDYWDERFTYTGGDPDFSLKVWEKGLAVVGCKRAKLLHIHARKSRKKFPNTVSEDNKLLIEKWRGKLPQIILKTESWKSVFWKYLEREGRIKYLFEIGRAAHICGDLEKAEKYYLKTLKLTDSSHINCLYNLASLYQQMGLKNKAKNLFKKAIEILSIETKIEPLFSEPSLKKKYLAGAYFHLACIYINKKRKAKKFLENCLLFMPNHKKARALFVQL